MQFVGFDESRQIVGVGGRHHMQRILVELQIRLFSDAKTCINSHNTCPSILILLDAWNLIETVTAMIMQVLLELGSLESRILGEGPVGLGR